MNTRQRILQYLQQHHTSTAEQLSRTLDLTQADIRYHIGQLLKFNQIEKTGDRLIEGRGRPATIYRLVQATRHDNLAHLAGVLLNLVDVLDDGRQMEHVAAKISEDFTPSPQTGRRMFQAVQALNALKYNARWEARPSSPLIILQNCPYREIIQDHPELCRMDASLLQKLTGMQARQEAKLEVAASGAVFCAFHLQKLV